MDNDWSHILLCEEEKWRDGFFLSVLWRAAHYKNMPVCKKKKILAKEME